MTSETNKKLDLIIARSTCDHLDDNKVIHDSQPGFNKGKVISYPVLPLYRRVYKAIDQYNNNKIIYLHSGKAFNMVLSQ